MSEFDQKAREWDKNKMHLARTVAVAAQLLKMVQPGPGLKAMEFGAGTGLLSFQLKDHFSEITLVDSSMEMLKMAEAKMEEKDQQQFRTLFMDLESETYKGEPFNIIYSQMVLHHVRDTGAMIKKFYEMLTPGGVLAIADLYSEDGSFHDGSTAVHHGFDPENLTELFLLSGFTGCCVEPCFIIPKEVSPETIREYPVFLMTATRL